MTKGFLGWPGSPIPGVSMGTSGLLALADLNTTAKRTVLTGTSTWLDVLVLAPGLHYQQNAESIGNSQTSTIPEARNLYTGDISQITNAATIHYLQRVGRKDKRVVLDVGNTEGTPSKALGARGEIFQSEAPPSSKLSAFLYYIPPCMTLTAIGLMIGSQDWWGLGIILALMFARALNIYVIRERVKEQPPPSKRPNVREDWWVVLHDKRLICLRGLAHDLEAITTGSWMRAPTYIEGYMEGASKLTVYLAAVFSGNQAQTGAIILVLLLLGTSGLLALSNTFASTFNMNGRTASVTPDSDSKTSRDSTISTSTEESTISSFEKGEVRSGIQALYPFSDEVNYV